MVIAEYIRNKIDRLPKGFVFTYTEFTPEVENKEAVIKTLNRMVASGDLNKLSKGRYYKSEETPFGTLEPSQLQVVKDLLEDNGTSVGYLTGLSTYHVLGLSTQISNTLQIGRKDMRPPLQRGQYNITFIKQKNTITKENIPLLRLLDAIRYIKKIPDTTPSASCKRLNVLFKSLDEKDVESLLFLARKYPPSTRALLGALLQETKPGAAGAKLKTLKESLNPITIYKLGLPAGALQHAQDWNIQ
jgi:hypothetical protein